MNIQDTLQTILFSVFAQDITLGQIIGFGAWVVFLFVLYRLLIRRLLPFYFKKKEITIKERQRFGRILLWAFLFLTILGSLFIFDADTILLKSNTFKFRLSNLVGAGLILQIARLLDWLVSKLMLQNFYANRHPKSKESGNANDTVQNEELASVPEAKATKIVQYIVYVISALFIIHSLQLESSFFFSTDGHEIDLSLPNILTAILILLVARLLSWVLVQLVLFRYYQHHKINVGSQYAINQLLKYIIYVLASLIALDQLGIEMKLIWGGAAALLVGVGLGLQQTFNDLISGIILLFERTVEIEDVVEVNGLIGKVKKIGLRTSLVETFDNITVVVPNSKLIVDNVINWSHYDDKARFHVSIGVAYGSDTALVKKVLLKVANDNIYILDYPMPLVRFVDFGDSALLFELHFWTRNFIVIEDIKSDMRFAIDQVFRAENISIPFPQRVVWSAASEGNTDGD